MKKWKKVISSVLVSTLLLTLIGCGQNDTAEEESPEEESQTEEDETVEEDATSNDGALHIDNSAWNYDSDNDVYWQIGVVYCEEPAAEEYESMGIYVPGAYMTGEENDDGTYTCTMDDSGEVNGYNAQTAPIVMPVNTAGYSAQNAPTAYSYDGLSSYIDAGMIYVYAGCRGRSNGYNDDGTLAYSGGAPWGVTDLKAAVRYIRYNDENIPGDAEKIFTFGHSGGGAQSALMGATGDSELYYSYLESIGAVMNDDDGNYISDAIYGAMSWCPITSLDYTNEAYEWMMGQYSSTNTRSDGTWTSALSDDLSTAFASYINKLGLTDEDGTVLTLQASENSIYTEGSYYEYLLSEIERSLNNFLSDTQFPYASGGNSERADGGFAGGGNSGGPGGMPSGEMPEGEMPEGGMPSGEMPEGGMPEGDPSQEQGESEAVTYETAQDYINSLNGEEAWITYNADTNTVDIISVEAFVTHCKNASKNVGAFDDLERSQAENMVFGNDENDALHFDTVMTELLENNQELYAAFADWDSSYVTAYQDDINNTDSLSNTSLTRQNMYNPMYYLSDYYEGYETSTVASHWRVHTGINQGDTSLTVEMNLALALEQYDDVESVDFEMVWGQGHTTAERTGDSTENFINWVNECSK